MRIKALSLGPYATNCYIVEEDGRAVIIDAPYPADAVIDDLRESSLVPECVLLTHGHHDHVFGLASLREAFPSILIYLSEKDMPYLEDDGRKLRKMLLSFDQAFLEDVKDVRLPDDAMGYGCYEGPFSIMETPGHTDGSVSIYSEKDGVLFSGDTLFQGGIGRTDLGGDYGMILSSLKALGSLPPDTRVLPGHGGMTTIGYERETNPYMR